MEQVLADVLGNTYLPPAAIAGRLLGAAVLGSVIGLDREWRTAPPA